MQSPAQRYFDALKLITNFGDTDWLRKNGESAYGLTYEEVLEMAYDNVLQEARKALHGRRRPDR